jgi:uncharacterized protein YbjT (DUF2867 family)
MKIRAIITGATGMVGEGVLHECLNHPDVEKILVINRRPCGVSDPKLTEIIHENFFDISPVEDRLTGYNACFYCLGITSVSVKEEEYYRMTYTLTLYIAERLAAINPGMTFCYVSGAGTDSTENGRLMWTRIKGKTENDLVRLNFRQVYNFRPGLMKPTKGLKNAHKAYALFLPFYPLLRKLFPSFISTLKELALAMINSVTKGYESQVLEVRDIVRLAAADDS